MGTSAPLRGPHHLHYHTLQPQHAWLHPHPAVVVLVLALLLAVGSYALAERQARQETDVLFARHRAELRALDGELRSLRASVGSRDQAIDDRIRAVRHLEHRIEVDRERAARNAAERRTLTLRIRALESRLADLDRTMADLVDETAATSARLTGLEEQRRRLGARRQALLLEVDGHQARLEEARRLEEEERVLARRRGGRP